MLGKRKNPAFGAFFSAVTVACNITGCVGHHVFVSLLFFRIWEFLFLSSHNGGNKTLHNSFGNDCNCPSNCKKIENLLSIQFYSRQKYC